MIYYDPQNRPHKLLQAGSRPILECLQTGARITTSSIGVKMNPIEYLPIYTKSNDSRINDYLEKQRITQRLHGVKPALKKPLNIRMAKRHGNGKIRLCLAGAALFALYIYIAAHTWGWL